MYTVKLFFMREKKKKKDFNSKFQVHWGLKECILHALKFQRFITLLIMCWQII